MQYEGNKNMLIKIKWWFEDRIYDVKDKWEHFKIDTLPILKKWVCSKKGKMQIATVIYIVIIINTLYGIISFADNMVKINREQINMCEAVPKWYEQLPEEHWIKSTDTYSYCFYELAHIEQALISTSSANFKMFIAALEEDESRLIQFIGQGLEYIDSKNQEQYALRYEDAERELRNLKIKIGESKKLQFSYDGTPYLFEFSLKELVNNISTKIIYSYIEDPSIAEIKYGEITGVQKGKTTLHIFTNGYHFEYPIKVK